MLVWLKLSFLVAFISSKYLIGLHQNRVIGMIQKSIAQGMVDNNSCSNWIKQPFFPSSFPLPNLLQLHSCPPLKKECLIQGQKHDEAVPLVTLD